MTFDPDFKVTTFFNIELSERTQDRAVVTIERQSEVVCALSNGDIFNDLDGLLTRFSRSRHFEFKYVKNGNNSKTILVLVTKFL